MIRMVSLYALRYEKHSSNDVGGLLNMLTRRGVSEQYKKVPALLFSILSFPICLYTWENQENWAVNLKGKTRIRNFCKILCPFGIWWVWETICVTYVKSKMSLVEILAKFRKTYIFTSLVPWMFWDILATRTASNFSRPITGRVKTERSRLSPRQYKFLNHFLSLDRVPPQFTVAVDVRAL